VLGNLATGGTKRSRFKVVEQMAASCTVQSICEVMQVSRSGYYRFLHASQVDRDRITKERIQAIYDLREGTYGYRRIQMELERRYGELVNHKRVYRLMKEMGIRSIIRRKRFQPSAYQVAVSDGRVAENLLNREFTAEKPNQKWVTDVTQYRVLDQRIYLSAIKDLFNTEIIAYQLSINNDNPLVLHTFEKAFEKHKDATGQIPELIVHSDQGSQYTSHAYHNMLPQVGAQISMSRRGNCYDNASMESFFSHLKAEALYPYDIRDIAEVQRRIENYIRFYNEERVQKKLNKLTPVEYRRQLVA
jgi:putative transposase